MGLWFSGKRRHFTFRMLNNSAHGLLMLMLMIRKITKSQRARELQVPNKLYIKMSPCGPQNRTQNPPQLFFGRLLSNKSVLAGGGDTCTVHVYSIKRAHTLNLYQTLTHTHTHTHTWLVLGHSCVSGQAYVLRQPETGAATVGVCVIV